MVPERSLWGLGSRPPVPDGACSLGFSSDMQAVWWTEQGSAVERDSQSRAWLTHSEPDVRSQPSLLLTSLNAGLLSR